MGALKEHTQLKESGISSKQSLNIVASQIKVKYVDECLTRLTINQLDDLVKTLGDYLYYFNGKKAVYTMCGIVKESTGHKVCFTDCALQVDTTELHLNELTENQLDDILSAIRKVICDI